MLWVIPVMEEMSYRARVLVFRPLPGDVRRLIAFDFGLVFSMD